MRHESINIHFSSYNRLLIGIVYFSILFHYEQSPSWLSEVKKQMFSLIFLRHKQKYHFYFTAMIVYTAEITKMDYNELNNFFLFSKIVEEKIEFQHKNDV